MLYVQVVSSYAFHGRDTGNLYKHPFTENYRVVSSFLTIQNNAAMHISA